MSNRKKRLALVTGSTAGIGFAIAEKLVRQDFDVIINGRTELRTANAVHRLIASGARPDQLFEVAADVTTVEGALKLQAAHPTVDILVNNFGAFEPKAFADLSDEDWSFMWNANVMSGVRLSRFYFPQMLKLGYGRVIFISSESALQIPADVIHYGVTKTAQIALARGMAELATATNVTVNSVLVGPTRSEGMENLLRQWTASTNSDEASTAEWFFENVRPSSLIKRFINPEEIGAFVAFLASEEASAITGAALRVDGGVLKGVV